MKITEIDVDDFGIWHNVSLCDLDERATVFYGPNEAGKTTLLNFVRTILYGFSADRRRRYLTTLSGGEASGSLHVSTPSGRVQLHRSAPSQLREEAETFRVISPAGGHLGNELLTVILSGIDETIFNNVFAVGLTQMQQLATLNDTDAADQLYGLATGVDRVCLFDVTRTLESQRDAILSAENDTDGRLFQLWKQRQRLERELQALRRDGVHGTKLREQQRQLTRKIEQQAATKTRFDGDGHWNDLSAELRKQWTRCRELNEELSELGPLVDVPRDVSKRIDELTEQIVERRPKWEQIRDERRRLKAHSQEFRGRDTLCQHAAEIEALDRQRPRILALEEDVARRQSQVEELEFEVQAELERLGLPVDTFTNGTPHVSNQIVESLRVPAREMKDLRQYIEAAKKAAADCRDEAKLLQQQLGATSPQWGGRQTASALEQTRQRVAQLERRREVSQQHQVISMRLDEMQDENQYWRQRGVLPWRGILVVGAIFASGAMLLLTGLFGSWFGLEDANSWTMMLIGGSLMVFSLVLKGALEQKALHRAESCAQQIEILGKQQQRVRAESEELDHELATGEGDIEQRLQAARRELTELEQWFPIRKRLDDLQREADATNHQVMIVVRQLKEARCAWKDSLRAVGLPETLTPSQIGKLSGPVSYLTQLHGSASEAKLRMVERRQELATICQRIEQLQKLAELNDLPEGLGPQLDRLLAELEEHTRSSHECDRLRQRWEELGQRQRRIAKNAGRLKRERRELFTERGISDLRDYRQSRSRGSKAQDLRHERDEMLVTISNKLSNVLEGDLSVDTLRKQLDNQPSAMGDRLGELDTERETLGSGLGELYERRGKLQQQLDEQVQDRRQEKKELALQVAEENIRAATTQWLRSAMTSAVLEEVRHNYETKRQPVTLAEASLFLERLTEGRYTRIWTPLGQSTLCVDDRRSQALPTEKLSRGTREQVFLALRLALVGSYRRRGVTMPMVLDDVFVNFDDQRARAAANVLMDVATAGQQLLIFTCHQRIRDIFSELGCDVRNLPPRTDALNNAAGQDSVQPEQQAIPAPLAASTAADKVTPEELAATEPGIGTELTLHDADHENKPLALFTLSSTPNHLRQRSHTFAAHDTETHDLGDDREDLWSVDRKVDKLAHAGPHLGRQRFTPAWRDVHLKPLPDLAPVNTGAHEDSMNNSG